VSRFRVDNLVSVPEIGQEILQDRDLVILDVRQTSKDAPDRDAYLRSHIEGALFADLDGDLAGISTGTNGRRPLPTPADFQKTVRRWGIDSGSSVIVYGAKGTSAPARAWWLLKWAGVGSVRLLDGGFEAWVAEGGAVEAGDPSPRWLGDFTIRPGQLRHVEIDDVEALVKRGILLDARPAAKFSGSAEDPGSGHISGAVSAPVYENFDENGKLKDETWLRERYRAYGVSADAETGAYCGTGKAAALEVFVLATLGIKATLYVGSWSNGSPIRRDPSNGDCGEEKAN